MSLWFRVQERNAEDSGISKATGTSRMEIEALLINAGICRETAGGKVQFVKDGWESFTNSHLPDGVQVGVKGSTRYVGRGRLTFPPNQDKRSSFNPPELASELKEKIRESTDTFNQKKETEKKAEAERKRQANNARASTEAREEESSNKRPTSNDQAGFNNEPSTAATTSRKKAKTSSDSTSIEANDQPMPDGTDGTNETNSASSGAARTAETHSSYASLPAPMEIDVNEPSTRPATVSPTNETIRCRGIQSTDANRDSYHRAVARGIAQMAECCRNGVVPEQIAALSYDARQSARGFLDLSGTGKRALIIHDAENNFNYVFHAPMCPIVVDKSHSDGTCAECKKARQNVSNIMSQMRISSAVHQKPSEPRKNSQGRAVQGLEGEQQLFTQARTKTIGGHRHRQTPHLQQSRASPDGLVRRKADAGRLKDPDSALPRLPNGA